MSLATRCPACSTVFRVVQDQLRVSGGWVRCGQCHEVFNGLQTLFELPADNPPAPAPAPAPAAGLFVTRTTSSVPAPLPVAPEADTTVDLGDEAINQTPADTPLIDASANEAPPPPPPLPFAYRPHGLEEEASEADTVLPVEEEEAPQDLAPEWPAAPDPDPDPEIEIGTEDSIPTAEAIPIDDASVVALFADLEQPAPQPVVEDSTGPVETDEVAPLAAAAPPEAEAGPAQATTAPLPAEPASNAVADAEPYAQAGRRGKRARKPAFMRQAERAARWRSPAVRAVLGSASTVLGLMLGLQVVHHQRDELAARWPAMQAPLASWCSLAGCQLQPPRALAALSLDSSALSQTSRPGVLRFEAELRNGADHVVRPPALELSFTDTLGHPLARKVLLPEQLAAPKGGLLPNQAWHVEVPLQVGTLQIAGFTAEVFYP